ELAKREGATLYMVLLAAFQTFLHRATGETRVVVASSLANRTHEALEKLIGFFVNMLPMHGDLRGDPPFAELLGRTKQVAERAYDRQELPFDRLVEELQPVRGGDRAPICQVFFALQNLPRGRLDLPGLELELLERPRTTAKYDLYLEMTELNGELRA